MARLPHPVDLDYSITVPIGVDVKGEMWSCVGLTGVTDLLGTRASVRVDGTIDDVVLENVGLMPTGNGELMLSVSAALRKKLRKQVGDDVRVTLTRRLT